MGKILDYIQQSSNGKFQCYKTKKLPLDANDNDTIAYNYDDNTVVQTTKSIFAETDRSRRSTVSLKNLLKENTTPPPIFRYFLDGSRHTYKVDDIAIGKKIFPIVAGQIIVGCCERKGRDIFKKYDLYSKIVLSMPDDFDDDDGGENFCRSYCESLNTEIGRLPFIKERGITIDKLLLYKTDGNTGDKDKDNYKNRAVAQIQNEMVDEEQLLVAQLCKDNRLNDESWLIKDGSLEYNPSFSNLGFDVVQWNNLRANYQRVVGVSKTFDPELLPDYEGNRLSQTIANLKPFERTKVYRYETQHKGGSAFYAVWYLRLRGGKEESRNFRETNFSDVVKCEMVLLQEDKPIETDMINVISANLIREAYPVCFGSDIRWANHLYPVFLTESFCKSHYINSNVILNLF
ncbi:MAG: hypothetical protein LBP56_05570 [Odoribacteraceae bacterium]|jgi:hypothetical protein|nr:hypothetical protein [Odoribacteraceae bacterium]